MTRYLDDDLWRVAGVWPHHQRTAEFTTLHDDVMKLLPPQVLASVPDVIAVTNNGCKREAQ